MVISRWPLNSRVHTYPEKVVATDPRRHEVFIYDEYTTELEHRNVCIYVIYV